MSVKLGAGIDNNLLGTFGTLTFWGLRRERKEYDDENTETGNIERRTYSVVSSAQGDMFAVALPGDVAEKDFPQGTEVEIVNPVIGSWARERFGGADAFWWINADDIIIKRSGSQNQQQPQKPAQQNVQNRPQGQGGKPPDGESK